MVQLLDKDLLKKVGTIVLLIVVLVISWQVYKKIKFTVQQPRPIPLPDDNPLGPFQGSFNPVPLTEKLYQDIRGWKFFNNYEPWKELSALSDTQVVQVMNEWDKRYFSTWGETLLEAFSGELRYKVNTWFSSANFLNVLRQRLERLEKLRK